MNYEELRKELYKKVRTHRGSINAIAKRLDMHYTTVSLILRGGYRNDNVIEMAAIVLKEYEQAGAKQRQNAAALLSEAVQLATA